VFIERSSERCAQLELLKEEFPELAKDIQIRRSDANSEIQDLCAKDWSFHRAVLFLDPYGMQVDWTTVEAIARTKIDVLALDEALRRLSELDARQAQVVELRFFGGLTLDEIAAMFGVSERTVKREWQQARAFLYHAMHSPGDTGDA
jgi:RNA polymerase sigma factor (sigma-70 family)